MSQITPLSDGIMLAIRYGRFTDSYQIVPPMKCSVRKTMRKAEPKADSHGVLRLNTIVSSPSAIVLFIAVAKLLFHLFTANRYGIFRDELYYLACAEHLDWGYVDQPPLIALITWFSTKVFGNSLLGLRFLPAAGWSRPGVAYRENRERTRRRLDCTIGGSTRRGCCTHLSAHAPLDDDERL